MRRILELSLTAVTGLLVALPALAQQAEQLQETEHQGGLPQITQTYTYAGQIFWTIVTFVLLYLAVSKIILPRIAGTMEERQDKIDDDLTRADKLKAEADQVMAEYDEGLRQSRAEASALLQAAQEAWATEAAERNAAEDAKLAEKVKADEARIAKARAEAEGNLKSIAATVAIALTDKLIGVTPAEQQASQAVDAAVQR